MRVESVDSESEMLSPKTDRSTDETLLNSIDKLSDACVMTYVLPVCCLVELGHCVTLNLGQSSSVLHLSNLNPDSDPVTGYLSASFAILNVVSRI